MTMQTTSDVLTSIRRTIVPLVVGYLLAQAARAGFSIDEGQLTGVIESLVTGVYYSALRILEVKWPQVGVLLGAMRQPIYL